MNLAQTIDLEEVYSLEPSFADLTDDIYTQIFLQEGAREARFLIDEHEEPLACALLTGTGWKITHFVYRKATLGVLERVEQVGGEIYQENRERYLSAVREYYSCELMKDVTPAVEDITEDRMNLVRDVLKDRWGLGRGEICLDCCCGSGIGSYALRTVGMTPLAYDNDPALLSLGLRQGRLLPESTMWIDATRATLYCTPVPRGLSCMLGEINTFTEVMWRRVVEELISLAEDVIITVGTEREARLVADWGQQRDRSVDLEERPSDPIYERWICQIYR
ncbi:MAG: hypothetical protein LUP99_02095 [Methanomicrobiales archaeon]|nr:hypothetical protein [Methanomicrobiales archaeon]